MVVAASKPGKTVGATFKVTRKGSVVGQIRLISANGEWDVKYIYASAILGDAYSGSVGFGGLDGGAFGEHVGGPVGEQYRDLLT